MDYVPTTALLALCDDAESKGERLSTFALRMAIEEHKVTAGEIAFEAWCDEATPTMDDIKQLERMSYGTQDR